MSVAGGTTRRSALTASASLRAGLAPSQRERGREWARQLAAAVLLCLLGAACIPDPGRLQTATVRNRTSAPVRIVVDAGQGAKPAEDAQLAPGEEKALGLMFVKPEQGKGSGRLEAYDAAGKLVFCQRFERTYDQAAQPLVVEVTSGATGC